MNTVPGIVCALQAAFAREEDVVLATVVKVENSAYRRPGARMLVCADGQSVGTVSGGCLESEIIRKAWWLTCGGTPVVCRYDTSAPEAQWAFGLGCNGAVHILLEHISTRSAQWHWLNAIALHRQPAACAVVIGSPPASPVAVGERLFIGVDGVQQDALLDAALQARVMADLAEVLISGISRNQCYPVDDGQVECFLEMLAPPPHLAVFGAGHDAVPLVRLASELGWYVTVADARSHFARAARFPLAQRVGVLDLADVAKSCAITRQSAAVVMTHSYEQDGHILAQLLAFQPRYIGQLGPRSRSERLLTETGTQEQARRMVKAGVLHYPVGLDIGADTPEEVALAILAEIKAALAGYPGGMLTQRNGAIHCAPGLETVS